MHLRISIGSAIALGVLDRSLDVLPTTVYLMLGEGCESNCGFCAQAKNARGGDHLSRVLWPPISIERLLGRYPGGAKRTCIQSLDYDGVVDDVVDLVSSLRRADDGVPISVSINPKRREDFVRIKEAGVEMVGLSPDAASREVFDSIKGPGVGGRYTWDETWEAMARAVEVFGKNRAAAHFIVGLGENDRDLAESLERAVELGCVPSLFAYTPVRGTWLRLSPPPIGRYRAAQALRHLIYAGGFGVEDFVFSPRGKLVSLPGGVDVFSLPPTVFETRGCPHCNRPYYNERPGGPLYNYPRPLKSEEVEKAYMELAEYLGGK